MPYIIAVLLLIVVGVGFTLFRSNRPTDNPPTIPTVVPDSSSSYKDGTYNSEITYLTPMQAEYKLNVVLSLKDGVITTADVHYSQGAEKDPNAQGFEKAYRTQVIGKDLDTISLSRVGGASLTTGAFNKALAEIKAEAQSS